MPLNSITPNDFSGSDSARIQQAIEAAGRSAGRVIIPRANRTPAGDSACWRLDQAIRLPGNLTLELHGCHLKLADHCRDNFIRSANCGLGTETIEPLENIHILGRGPVLLEGADRPRATGDSAKTLGARTFGTDAGVAGESQQGDWRNIGILLARVEGFRIEGLAIRDAHAWAISLERCGRGVVRDIDFAMTEEKVIDGACEPILNQDGLDLRQGCHDILIENLTGHTGDDLVALTAIPHAASTAGSTKSTMVSAAACPPGTCDDIRHIILRNLRGYCHGGHNLVRLLNSAGLRIHDILIDGVVETLPADRRCTATVRIGDTNPTWGGPAPLGDTCRIQISRVDSRAEAPILVAGSLSDAVITQVTHTAPEAVVCPGGPKAMRNVVVSQTVAAAR